MEKTIKTSSENRQSETGATRDSSKNKGRVDLLPIESVQKILDSDNMENTKNNVLEECGILEDATEILFLIFKFVETGEVCYLEEAMTLSVYQLGEALEIEGFNKDFRSCIMMGFIEVSKHYEKGGEIRGFNNWKLGMPIDWYINSAFRHCIKTIAKLEDEPHPEATSWNLMCAYWTYMKKNEKYYPIKPEIKQ